MKWIANISVLPIRFIFWLDKIRFWKKKPIKQKNDDSVLSSITYPHSMSWDFSGSDELNSYVCSCSYVSTQSNNIVSFPSGGWGGVGVGVTSAGVGGEAGPMVGVPSKPITINTYIFKG
jgi:hypothetical protein